MNIVARTLRKIRKNISGATVIFIPKIKTSSLSVAVVINRTGIHQTEHRTVDPISAAFAREQGRTESVAVFFLPKIDMSFRENRFRSETGKFVKGGPAADTGLTGRKIIVDTYGGMGRHGGGAFSGKGPNKQDRSGAYMARYVAKNLVASGVCDKCRVELKAQQYYK